VLDPAHGGPDAGARLGNNVLEKDVTQAMATRLRQVLTSEGFTVVTTREGDPPAVLPNDQRAEFSNRTHAVACIVLHATAAGTGIHIYASALAPKDPPEAESANYRPPFVPTAWDEAQSESVRQSAHLESDLSKALMAGGFPIVAGRASVAPLDNLTCPAVAIEVAPLGTAGNVTPVNDPGYQQRIAETIARALLFWRGHADPPAPHVTATTADWLKAIPTARTGAAVKAQVKPAAARPAVSTPSKPRTGKSAGSDVLDGAGATPPGGLG
jgi:N-acetylmuramoyl-L-alanine amidase